MQNAAMLANDKLFKTSNSEAIESVGCERLACELSSIKLSAVANQCTLHHFSTEFETDGDSFKIITNLANDHDYYKDLLKKSKMRG